MPSLNRDKMPVASNRRCKRSCNPCSLSSVLQFRAIFNASIRVATPELSIWVTPDKSMLTVLGCGACKRAISWSRTAGEESISIRPYKDANAPFSLATIFIPDFSILSLLLLSTESGPFQHDVLCLYALEQIPDRYSDRNSSAASERL